MTEKINSIKEKIISEIKSGKIKMRPRLYFWLKILIFTLGVIIFSIIALFLISFVFFSLNLNGGWLLTGFGFPGIKYLFISIPWLLVIIVLIFIFLVELVIANFRFAYRRPLVYSLALLLLFAIVGGFFVHKTSLHQRLLLSAEKEELPILGPIYINYSKMRFPNTHTGVISSLSEGVIEIREPNGVLLRIPVPGKEMLLEGKKIKKGDVIIMMDKKIKKVDEDSSCFKYNQRKVKPK